MTKIDRLFQVLKANEGKQVDNFTLFLEMQTNPVKKMLIMKNPEKYKKQILGLKRRIYKLRKKNKVKIKNNYGSYTLLIDSGVNK